MKIAKQYDFRLPVFLLSALVNHDTSGLEEDDIRIWNIARTKFEELAKGLPYTISGWEDSDNTQYFSYQPDFCSLGCNVVDITLNIFCDHPTGTVTTDVLEIVPNEYVKVAVTDTCDKCNEVIKQEMQTFKFLETEVEE